jgi:hypothetical protein
MRAVLALAMLVVTARAKDPAPQWIQVAPGDFVLSGAWASQRLVVTGKMPDGSLRDVTALARFQSSALKIATVDKIGFVSPKRDGDAVITVSVGKQKQKVRVTVRDSRRKLASFRNDVEPILATLGCNSAQCHGAQRGKGGLKLSLFGGDPDADLDALTRAAGGRRVNRSEPRESLLFLKATGGLPHQGKTARPGTPEYEKLLAWLEAGAPAGSPTDPQIAGLRVYPDERLMPKGQSQRLLVMASFSDGTQRDVTADATIRSSSQVAVVENGAVRAEDFGETTVTATYLHRSAVFRLGVPQPGPKRFPALTANNRIDELVYAKLKTLGIPPSGPSADEAFLRRVYLDVTGLLPTPEQARPFLADPSPTKRAALIDQLIASDGFADFWSLKWGDLLRIKSEYPVRLWPKAVAVYYQWLHQSIAENKPYDQFARELLTATGSNFRVGPANFVRAVPSKDARTTGETAALVFMGARVGCARCHAHPVESWTMEDDLGIGAFFARLGYKSTGEWKEEIVYPDFKGVLRHPRTRQAVAPRAPGGAAVKVAAEEDPRGQFAQWLTASENPWFARNAVNRVWYWIMGTGIVNEPDDLRPTNPPTNPELLAFLERELVEHRYDLRHIYRLILNSQTYQRSSEPNEWNARDTTHFSHYVVKRLAAEQMLDALTQVTGVPEKFRSIIPEPFSNWPSDFKATQLADGNMECSFLDLFGRPGRDTPYESERDSDVTLRQTLYFLNSEQFEQKVSTSPKLKALLGKKNPEALDELYLTAVSRLPAPDEKEKLLVYLKKGNRGQALQDIAWALLNAKEFEFNH